MPRSVKQAKQQARGLGDGVEIRKSAYGGSGLFATRVFPRNSAITWFDGPHITRDAADKLLLEGRASHVITITPFHDYIDGVRAESIQPGQGAASLANDANYTENGYRSGDGANNAREYRAFDGAVEKVYLVAKNTISPGDEITWRYMMCTTQDQRARSTE